MSYTAFEKHLKTEDIIMQLDRRSIDTLLALDDAQLKFVINRVAATVGIDTAYFGLKGQDVDVIRKRLQSITDAELSEARRQMENKQRGK